MQKYQDRYAAGKKLASFLQKFQHDSQVLVLALPRGGVPVAHEIAQFLQALMDVFVVRKLGVPNHDELAMGAIASGDTIVFNDWVLNMCDITPAAIQAVIEKEKNELQRREKAYRGNRPFPNISQKKVILVDDGMATGATMRAAIKALRTMHPLKIIVAIPVAPFKEAQEMKKLADEWYCPIEAPHLEAVGEWYEDFSQTEDEEVHRLLNKGVGLRQ